jgi:DNA repair protein RadC
MLRYAVGDSAPAAARLLLNEAATLPRAISTPTQHVQTLTGDGHLADYLALLVEVFNHTIEVGLKAPEVRPMAKQVEFFLLHRLNHEKVEVLYGLFFSANGALLHERELGRGNMVSCHPSPAEIARTALSLGAAAVVLAHNHPSGSAEPSAHDVRFSAAVAASLSLAEAVLVDHLVIGNGAVVSMRRSGLLPTENPVSGGMA